MSNKNFVAYGDAETILTEYAEAIDKKESIFRFSTMPTASSTNVGQIIQYIGTTDANYTNGYFYKCVAQGTDPETYAWEQTNVQPTSEGDERVKPEITEMGVKFDDGLRPYIKVDVSTIIPPFADATWDDIVMISDLYYSGDLSLEDIQDVWSVGDSKGMLVSAMPATGVGETHAEQTVSLKLVDFNHDALVTSEGEKTKALLTLGFELAESGAMNETNVQDTGWCWETSTRRTWCNTVCKDALPSIIRNSIKPITRTVDIAYGETTTTTDDSIFIPTIVEFIGRVITNAEAEAGVSNSAISVRAGTLYSLYNNTGIRSKNVLSCSPYYIRSSAVHRHIGVQGATPSNTAFGTNSLTSTASGLMPHFCI